MNLISASINATFAVEETMYWEPAYDNNTMRMNGLYIETRFGYDSDPLVMVPLYHAQDLNLVFEAIARSLTNRLRESSDTPPLPGKSSTVQVVLQVHWVWIILPLAVLIGGLLQLQIAIAMSRKTSTPVWKSSSLAVLSRGGEAARLLQDCRTLEEFEAKAKEEQVDLFPPVYNALTGIGMANLIPQQYHIISVDASQSIGSTSNSGTSPVPPTAGSYTQPSSVAISTGPSLYSAPSIASTIGSRRSQAAAAHTNSPEASSHITPTA